jgi:alpha-tubulin suppressor-like RCC1 family protein
LKRQAGTAGWVLAVAMGISGCQIDEYELRPRGDGEAGVAADVAGDAGGDAAGDARGDAEGDAGSRPRVRDIALGEKHSCVVLEDDTVLCWGGNEAGQLGRGTIGGIQARPGVVTGLANVVEVVAGSDHSCARLRTGTVSCWGGNAAGQLGDGTITNRATPTNVRGLSGVTQIGAGAGFTCALRSDGTVVCWGSNAASMIDDGSRSNRMMPTQISGLSGVAQIGLGGLHACARFLVGGVSCWGSNLFAALTGTTTPSESAAPVQVDALEANVTQLATGTFHNCVRYAVGTVGCWGQNLYGKLGLGSTSSASAPMTVPGLTGAGQITSGGGHSCARLDASMGVVCWGYNASGQLGNGTTTDQPMPTSVPRLLDVTQVVAGASHTCARQSDGTISCWGLNDVGQVGDGSTTNRSMPTPVMW